MNNTLTYALLAILISLNAIAIEPSAVRFNRLSVEQGLSQITVNTIIQDHQGFIWFGTNDGLNRYDGYQFKYFRHDPEDPNSISSSQINVIYQDSQANLWIGTASGGLNLYHRDTEQFRHFVLDDTNTNSISDNSVTAIIEDHNQQLWIATMNGLNQYNPKTDKFTRYKHIDTDSNSLIDNRIYSLHYDQYHQLWIGSQGEGLTQLKLDTQQFNHFIHHNQHQEIINSNIRAITTDHQGKVWTGTENNGLSIYDPRSNSFQHLDHDSQDPHSLSGNKIWVLTTDQQGAIWVGTQNSGLNYYDAQRERFIHYQHRPLISHSLSHNHIRSIFQDQLGQLWIGTFAGGSNRIDTKQSLFGHTKHYAFNPDGLNHNIVVPILLDSRNQLWIGTLGGGINVKPADQEQFKHYLYDPEDPHSISNNNIWTIFEDSAQQIWIGTQSGLNRYDPKKDQFEHYYHEPNNPNSLSNNWVSSIVEDQRGQLWIGTRGGGLNKFDPKTNRFQHFRHIHSDPNSLSDDTILTVFLDNQGFLWLGTWSRGLERFDPYDENFQHHLHDQKDPNSLSNNTVISITQDSRGYIWATTLGGGINKYHHKTNHFSHYREKDGLANDTVYAILEDQQHYLWASTNQGLSKFDPIEETFENFTVDDGLQHNEFNGNSFFKSDKGELFFGGINGFNRFDPQQIEINKQAPQLVFTDLLLFNESVPIVPDPTDNQPTFSIAKSLNELTELTLTYQQSLISFEFSALNFHSPYKSQYRYQLDGIDQHWIVSSPNIRRATYTNLPSGSYTLRVIASNGRGYWNNSGISLDIHVLPPPWQAWWAYAIYSLLITSIISLFVYQQIKKRQAINQHNKRLGFALWGSGDELWDIDLLQHAIISQNRLTTLATTTHNDPYLSRISLNKIHQDDVKLVKNAIKHHLNGDIDHYEATYRAQTTAGEWIWLLDRGKINEWDDQGRPSRICGTTKNIQQLKSTEEELRLLTIELEQRVEQRTGELKRSNDHLKNTQEQLIESKKMAALGNLVIGISHEINTPVGISITAISTLRENVEALDAKLSSNKLRKQDLLKFQQQSQQSIALTLSNLHRTSRLVEYFKQVAVSQSGEQLSEIRLAPLLRNTVNSSISQVRSEIQGVQIECPDKLKITTYVGVLRQIISQLVDNTLEHGYLISEPINIAIKVSVHNQQINLSYTDQGKGMDEQTQKQVFDPFYTTNRGAHIGLGMHVTYNQIRHLLRGNIQCESAPHKGCHYLITIPETQLPMADNLLSDAEVYT